jgi:hypothetical protein
MGGHAREPSGRLRLGLLVALAALFALIPAARAAADFTLTVNVVGEGEVWCEAEFEGEIEFEYDECGETELELPEGTEVLLEAIESGDEFKEFKGCDSVGPGPEECRVTMDEDRVVTAVFGPEPVNENTLSITIDGTGSGQVKCELEVGPEPCKSIYPEENEFTLTEVTLVPVEDEGSEFAGFSGDCSGLVCELTMDEDHEVTVTFNLKGGGENEETAKPPAGPTPPPLSGEVRVGGAGLYRAGKATLRLTCKGGGPCKGTVKLIATLRAGKKRKRATVVGKAAFSLPANGSRTIKVKLSPPAVKLLGRGGTLTAKARGAGVTASRVRITPSAR